MITSLVATLVMLAPSGQAPEPLSCAMQPEPALASMPKVDYAGIRFGFCCGGCVGGFSKAPAEAIKKAVESKRTIGQSLYDPVAGVKLDPNKPQFGPIDAKGIRYYFASEANQKAFEAEPAKFAAVPAKAAMYCSVMKHDIRSYADAGAYSDFEGVRYFFCCPNCVAEFRKDPAVYAKNAAAKVTTPKVTPAPKKGS